MLGFEQSSNSAAVAVAELAIPAVSATEVWLARMKCQQSERPGPGRLDLKILTLFDWEKQEPVSVVLPSN